MANVDYHLVADWQDRADTGLHREIELDGVPNDGKARNLDHNWLQRSIENRRRGADLTKISTSRQHGAIQIHGALDGSLQRVLRPGGVPRGFSETLCCGRTGDKLLDDSGPC